MLPGSLQALTFGYRFSQQAADGGFGLAFNVALPRSLQTLSFGGKFGQSLEGARCQVARRD